MNKLTQLIYSLLNNNLENEGENMTNPIYIISENEKEVIVEALKDRLEKLSNIFEFAYESEEIIDNEMQIIDNALESLDKQEKAINTEI